jgi:glycosyltransferase involved in cell wall biosynthesis
MPADRRPNRTGITVTLLPEPVSLAPVALRLRAVPGSNLGTVATPPSRRAAGPYSRGRAVVLVTEGTYPHGHGGVSVWCDQLVRGLPDVPIEVVALTAFRYQRPVWDVPDTVRQVTTLGLWDARRPRRLESDEALSPAAIELGRLLAAPADDVAGFRRLLDRLARTPAGDVGRHVDVTQLLYALDRAVPASRWEPLAGTRAADLVTVAEMLDHLLRPLGVDPGPAAIYHASSNGLAALVCMVAQRRYGARFLLTEHGVYLRERYLELHRMTMSRAAKALLVRFHRLVTAAAYAEAAIIAPGSRWNQRWEARYGAPAARVQTIYNGIDPDEFPSRIGEPAEPVVAWLGRIDPIKDLATLIRSFAVVAARRPDARLRLYGRVAAGAEGYKASLDALVTELGLDGVVTFEGGVAASADAYREAQVGVLSSISEGFPYSLIEAMACGLPTVATGVGGVPEAVTDGGLVVPPRSPEQMGAAILSLLADAPRRRDMGTRARRRVLGLFTLEHCLEGYRQVYDELSRSTGSVLYLARRPGRGPTLAGGPDAAPVTALPPEHEAAVVAAVGGAEALALAVDAEEVAATLESVGVTDAVAADAYASPDVFALAERTWAGARSAPPHGPGAGPGSKSGSGPVGGPGPGLGDRVAPVPPRPAEPTPAALRGSVTRGIAYVLPALVVAAAALAGAPQAAVVAASAVGWGLAQGGGALAYTVLNRTSDPGNLAPLRRGLAAGVVGVLAAAALVAVRASPADGLGVALPLLHLLGATALVMGRRTRLLLVLLAPVSAVSIGALAVPTTGLGDLVVVVSVVTVAATLVAVGLAAWWGGAPARAVGGDAGGARRGALHLLEPADWWRAVPVALCGWATAAFALLAVSGAAHIPGFSSAGSRTWLLVGLPLWVMVAGCEWFLLRLRASLRRLLGSTGSLRAFRSAARWAVTLWLALAAAVLEVATAIAAVVAGHYGVDAAAALVAASVFCLVALALLGVTILTAAGRVGLVGGVVSAAALVLAGAASTPYDLAGFTDDAVSLAVAAATAIALWVAGARTLVDPTTHR